MSVEDANERLPRHGDTLSNGWTVDYISNEMVWCKCQHNPIPLENVAPTDRPGVWKLVGITSTEGEGVKK
jgi:hypothetical protein